MGYQGFHSNNVFKKCLKYILKKEICFGKIDFIKLIDDSRHGSCNNNWAATWQNPQNECAQRRLRSAWASALRTQAFFMRTANTLIRLGGYHGWSESSLDTHLLVLSCRGSYYHRSKSLSLRRSGGSLSIYSVQCVRYFPQRRLRLIRTGGTIFMSEFTSSRRPRFAARSFGLLRLISSS